MKSFVGWCFGGGLLGSVLVITLGQDADQPTYVGLKGCVCHKLSTYGNQIGHWKEKDPHAKAYELLKGEKSKEVAGKIGIADPLKDGRCLRCHATAFVAPEAQRANLAMEDGVSCEGCHGPGSKYHNKQVMSDRKLAVANGLIPLKESDARTKLCSGCHNEKDVPEAFYKERDFDKDWAPLNHPLAKPAK